MPQSFFSILPKIGNSHHLTRYVLSSSVTSQCFHRAQSSFIGLFSPPPSPSIPTLTVNVIYEDLRSIFLLISTQFMRRYLCPVKRNARSLTKMTFSFHISQHSDHSYFRIQFTFGHFTQNLVSKFKKKPTKM